MESECVMEIQSGKSLALIHGIYYRFSNKNFVCTEGRNFLFYNRKMSYLEKNKDRGIQVHIMNVVNE